jgi:hypothetical protein
MSDAAIVVDCVGSESESSNSDGESKDADILWS